MTTKELLHSLVEPLTDKEAESLYEELREELDCDSTGQKPRRSVIHAREYPVLAAVWDNDDDAIFDHR